MVYFYQTNMQNKKRKKNYLKTDGQPDCSGLACLQQPFTDGKPVRSLSLNDEKNKKKRYKSNTSNGGFCILSMDGKTAVNLDHSPAKPGSLPDFNSCPSDIIIVKVYKEPEITSTLYTPTSSSFVSSNGLGTRESSSRYHI